MTSALVQGTRDRVPSRLAFACRYLDYHKSLSLVTRYTYPPQPH